MLLAAAAECFHTTVANAPPNSLPGEFVVALAAAAAAECFHAATASVPPNSRSMFAAAPPIPPHRHATFPHRSSCRWYPLLLPKSILAVFDRV